MRQVLMYTISLMLFPVAVLSQASTFCSDYRARCAARTSSCIGKWSIRCNSVPGNLSNVPASVCGTCTCNDTPLIPNLQCIEGGQTPTTPRPSPSASSSPVSVPPNETNQDLGVDDSGTVEQSNMPLILGASLGSLFALVAIVGLVVFKKKNNNQEKDYKFNKNPKRNSSVMKNGRMPILEDGGKMSEPMAVSRFQVTEMNQDSSLKRAPSVLQVTNGAPPIMNQNNSQSLAPAALVSQTTRTSKPNHLQGITPSNPQEQPIAQGWVPQQADELLLTPYVHTVIVMRYFDDGWCEGYCPQTRRTGFFPTTCLDSSNADIFK